MKNAIVWTEYGLDLRSVAINTPVIIKVQIAS